MHAQCLCIVIASQCSHWRGERSERCQWQIKQAAFKAQRGPMSLRNFGHRNRKSVTLASPFGRGGRAQRGRRGSTLKICQWHIFSVDLSGYAAVASILFCTAPSFSVDLGSYAAVASIWVFTVPLRRQALSVTFGDSSPKGRAKGGAAPATDRISVGRPALRPPCRTRTTIAHRA